MNIGFHPAAGEELVETAAYYESEVEGLGTGFIREVERVAGLLQSQPRIGQPLGGRYRRIVLARFPYSLIYTVETGRIGIIAVAHQRRRPGYWRNRHFK